MAAAACGASLVLFAVLVQYSFPVQLTALLPLSFSALLISRDLVKPPYLFQVNLSNLYNHRMLAWYAIAILVGIAGGLNYRGNHHMPLYPQSISWFVLVAILVAITEELVFRGFIQARLSLFHPVVAVLFAALAHTCYKAGLFLSPAAVQEQDMAAFFVFTLLASSVAGLIKQWSGHLLPAIITHIVFDIMVYAEATLAPWWVW